MEEIRVERKIAENKLGRHNVWRVRGQATAPIYGRPLYARPPSSFSTSLPSINIVIEDNLDS